MGTSTAFNGQGGGTPLVPSWLEGDGSTAAASDPPEAGGQPPDPPATSASPSPSTRRPPIPAAADAGRFTAARSNFSRFAGSDGRDGRSLGRAVSHYVGSSAGGARTAAARMGSSRAAGSRLLGFLSDAVTQGAPAALRTLNLGALAGRPIDEIFLGLVDYVCPDGGSIDEGIAREAFIETIADLAESGITTLDGLSADQMQTIFELYATNAIEARLCNDIGTKVITLPSDAREVARVQAQLHDFIQRGVADALTAAGVTTTTLTQDRVLGFVARIYEQAFSILQAMGNEAAEET